MRSARTMATTMRFLVVCFGWCVLSLPGLCHAAKPHFEPAPLLPNVTCRAYYSTSDIALPYQTSHIVATADMAAEDAVIVFWEKNIVTELGNNAEATLYLSYCTEDTCDCNKQGELKLPCTYTADQLLQAKLSVDVPVVFNVTKTGVYCIRVVATAPLADIVSGTLEFYYPYGGLPSQFYPLLPFYGAMALAYLVVGVVWAILAGCYWREILQVQVYITGVIFLCMLEMSVYFGYYHNYNISGTEAPYLFDLAVTLNAARFTVSFVALLVVSMGYGLVKPTLGTAGYRVMLLGLTHFVFNAMFLLHDGGPIEFYMAFLFVFPLAITLTIFYSWTLKSLTETIKKLELRRQVAKVWAYKWLYRILFVSIIVLIVLTVIGLARTDYDKYWETLWLRQAAFQWLYFAVFICIIFLWRPRQNNTRYGVEEIPMMEDYDEEPLTEVVGSPSDKVVKRKKFSGKKNGKTDEEAEEDLKWVEENIPDVEDDGGGSANAASSSVVPDSDLDEARLIRQELSKMN